MMAEGELSYAQLINSGAEGFPVPCKRKRKAKEEKKEENK